MIVAGAESRPGSAAPNEDLLLVADTWALVLDGITRYPDDGCVHDVPWYTAALAEAVAVQMAGPPRPLADVLAAAIDAVSARHAPTCDLDNPVTPGATAALVRSGPDALDWLVLGDCAITWTDRDGKCRTETDDRLAAVPSAPAVDLAGVRRWPVEHVARFRNRDGGFWVAAADPRAAARARTGTAEGIGDLLLCTDGLTRLTERYEYAWPDLMGLAAREGTGGLLDLVRDCEARDPNPGAKRHDDATAVLLRFADHPFASL
ncbi:protein phosphatase 2C domain-containing protein [Glycomyces mayteni]|uniref:Protein phosphatase 2C domain-containing protein n=1 Tax=Glycomyces mayteni TaxID=543887 RepID=A0ABW2DGA1_9ACTN|nr:protein phosphatase 2C domain-containing protein [Glycomyces mayteni]